MGQDSARAAFPHQEEKGRRTDPTAKHIIQDANSPPL